MSVVVRAARPEDAVVTGEIYHDAFEAISPQHHFLKVFPSRACHRRAEARRSNRQPRPDARRSRDAADTMTQRRKVGYALTQDGYHIAYAVLGQGEIYHVFMGEFVSVVDEVQWQHPAIVRLERFPGVAEPAGPVRSTGGRRLGLRSPGRLLRAGGVGDRYSGRP